MFQIIYIDGLTPYTWTEVLDEYVNLEVRWSFVLLENLALISLCQSPQSEEEYLFVQKYGDSLWSAKVEVERYFQGVKASYYKACGEYQMVSIKNLGLGANAKRVSLKAVSEDSCQSRRMATFELSAQLASSRAETDDH